MRTPSDAWNELNRRARARMESFPGVHRDIAFSLALDAVVREDADAEALLRDYYASDARLRDPLPTPAQGGPPEDETTLTEITWAAIQREAQAFAPGKPFADALEAWAETERGAQLLDVYRRAPAWATRKASIGTAAEALWLELDALLQNRPARETHDPTLAELEAQERRLEARIAELRRSGQPAPATPVTAAPRPPPATSRAVGGPLVNLVERLRGSS